MAHFPHPGPRERRAKSAMAHFQCPKARERRAKSAMAHFSSGPIGAPGLILHKPLTNA